MQKKEKNGAVATNRKASHNYFLSDEIECGIELKGTEIKSIRKGGVNLKDSFVKIDNAEAFLYNCHISPYEQGNRYNHEAERTRKLLLNKKEILKNVNLEINDNGEWKLDYNKAVKFYHNLDSVLPQEVGSVLSPMPIQKISFEKSNVGDTNSIADAERDLYTAAGVSQLLFNSDKPSANALALSIKIDQSITFGIVKSIQCAVNRFIHRQPYGKNFKVTFLDCSPFNRKELGDEYLKACQYGLPMISYFAATQGMSQEEVDCMNFLESDVLDLTERFKPLRSSATLGADTGEAGAPEKEDTELTEQGEQWREDQ